MQREGREICTYRQTDRGRQVVGKVSRERVERHTQTEVGRW